MAMKTTTVLGFLGISLNLSAAIAVAGQPIVQLTKDCPNMRYLGRNATFKITVTNTGDGPAHDVIVTDVVPRGLQFVSADNAGALQGDKLQWRVGTLNAGESRALISNFTCTSIGQFRNMATVTYCAESTKECAFEVRGIPAILLECVDDPDPIEINSPVTYTITVTNQGSALGTNISVSCTLPDTQEYVSAVGPTTAAAAGKNVTFPPLPSLAPAAKAIYKVTVKGIGEGDTRFRVEMKSDQMESPVMETESTRIYR